jgi:hypothetical protein
MSNDIPGHFLDEIYKILDDTALLGTMLKEATDRSEVVE